MHSKSGTSGIVRIALVGVERNSGVRLEARFALAAEYPHHDAYERSDKDKKVDCSSHGYSPRDRAIARASICGTNRVVVRPEAEETTFDGPPILNGCFEIDQDVRADRGPRCLSASVKPRPGGQLTGSQVVGAGGADQVDEAAAQWPRYVGRALRPGAVH
jgi:hypothetical protein